MFYLWSARLAGWLWLDLSLTTCVCKHEFEFSATLVHFSERKNDFGGRIFLLKDSNSEHQRELLYCEGELRCISPSPEEATPDR